MTSSTSSVQARGRAALVVLGCAKNQVEMESMSSRLAREGWELTSDFSAARVAVVHTCGFLAAARQEALDTVARVRKAAPRAFLVMTGCFAQYLGGRKPANVDALLGTGEFHRLPELIDGRLAPAPSGPSGYHDAATPRPLRPGQLSAYLRISEGCNHRCTFCVIPQLRGNLRSRPPADIYTEARGLVDRGVRELVLISQDTTDYGRDLSSGTRLADLVRELASWPDLRWIRLLYAYPAEVDEGLIDLLAREEKLCGYLDMPLQHLSDRVLRAMGRDWGRDKTLALLERLKERVSRLALRTTFIVGFPGETEDDFQDALKTVESGVFEHVGVFPYSLEDRSPSSRLGDLVPTAVADERWDRLMQAQAAAARRRALARVGTEVELLIEPDASGQLTARAAHQAPEVDGGVMLDDWPEKPGFHRAIVTGWEDPHLTARLRNPATRDLRPAARR